MCANITLDRPIMTLQHPYSESAAAIGITGVEAVWETIWTSSWQKHQANEIKGLFIGQLVRKAWRGLLQLHTSVLAFQSPRHPPVFLRIYLPLTPVPIVSHELPRRWGRSSDVLRLAWVLESSWIQNHWQSSAQSLEHCWQGYCMPHVKVRSSFGHEHAFFFCFGWQYQKESRARTHGNCKSDGSEITNIRGILLLNTHRLMSYCRSLS